MGGFESATPTQQQAYGSYAQAGSQALGGVASLAQGYARSAAERSFADYAARLGERNAVQAKLTAEGDASRAWFIARQRLGLLRTQLASSGVTMSGTPAQLFASQAAEAEYQVHMIRYGGKVNAMQARYSADAQAFQYRINAGAAEQAGYAGLLSGFGAAGGSYLRGRALAAEGQMIA